PLTRKLDIKRLFQIYKQKDALFDQQYNRQEISIWQYRTMRFIETLAEFDSIAHQKDADEFQSIYLSVSQKHMRTRSEIFSLLERLQKCFKLGIVTNGTLDMQSAKIQGIGIKPFFTDETIFISEHVGFEKPDPKIYEAALHFFDVQPGETVFIGDSWQNDVRGPYNIGIKPIWLNRKQHPMPEELPVKMIHDLQELELLLCSNCSC
ncbi:MAG: family hydrolase, partial [Bacilli bacterium]|nr:family hydrolase [Bacilli bacterium]